MINKFLPIGSVVKVKEIRQKMMIFAIMQTSEENKRTYDYLAVPYPHGQIDRRMNLGFDNDKIEEVFFRGYEDETRDAFFAALEIVAQKEKE